MKKILILLAFFLGINVCFAEEVIDLEIFEVSSCIEIIEAISSEENNIVIELNSDILMDQLITIPSDKNVTIKGNNFSFLRLDKYASGFFKISKGATLNLDSLTIDGGAAGWKMDYDNHYYTGANNTGYVRIPTISDENDIVVSATLISNSGSLNLLAVTIQNARSTISGSVISGAGNNNIKDSVIKHNGSSKPGGALYITGGTTIIDGSTFEENTAGVGVTTSQTGGAIYTSGVTLLDVKNNSVFKNNSAQGNGGALYISNTSVSFLDTVFSGNIVGNDGSVMNLTTTLSDTTASFNKVTFEGNKGLAMAGQSLGVVYISKWAASSLENPITAKNIIATNNSSVTGLFSDICDVNVIIEDSEIYENNIRMGTAVYSQAGKYLLKNVEIHDNTSLSHSGAIYLRNPIVEVEVESSKIYNNTAVGTGIITVNGGGILTIKDTEIYNNECQKGTVAVIGSSADNPPLITVENSSITFNKATEYGGGFYIKDSADIKSTLVLDENTKIYGNTAGIAGDDLVYMREESEEKNNLLDLNEVGKFNINGLDGWYFDEENERYVNTLNPLAYVVDPETGVLSFYLKAAGEVELSYDLNGGSSNNDYEIEHKKYGSSFDITDDKPIIANGVFVGWNTEIDGSGHWYYDVDEYNGEYGKVLYAQYKFEEIKQPEIINPDTLSGDIISMLILGIILSFSTLIIYINSGVKLK